MNESEKKFFDEIISETVALGAFKANVIEADKVETDSRFRDACAANSCGMYGKCWTCPPDAGDIDVLMAKLRNYKYALVYQTVGELEDSFDFEGMARIGSEHNVLVQKVRDIIRQRGITDALHLGAGGCRICEVCAKRTNEPCRFPDKALSSLEAHGVYVSRLAETAGMKYINGKDTVTYFGSVFFNI